MLSDLDAKMTAYQNAYDSLVVAQADSLQIEDAQV